MVFSRQDAWRRHPFISRGYRHAFPGLGNAIVIFGVYCVGEQLYEQFFPQARVEPHRHYSPSEYVRTEGFGVAPTFEPAGDSHGHGHH